MTMNQEHPSDKMDSIIDETTAADTIQEDQLSDEQLENVAGGGKVGKFFDNCLVGNSG